jgi:hypothetical protein
METKDRIRNDITDNSTEEEVLSPTKLIILIHLKMGKKPIFIQEMISDFRFVHQNGKK